MGNAEKLRRAAAAGVKAAVGRGAGKRANKRAIKARRRVSRNAPGSGSTSPETYGVGMPENRFN